MRKPVVVDLFCGLGGWSEGFLAEGWDCVGFDIEQHVYGDQHYPGMLAIQDVLTLHGSQFRNADLIVASPPCQEYSYMAMPWSLAKEKARKIRADETGQAIEDLNRLFNACFRIQREACEAAGRHIPMVVENVRGAIPWVGRSRWNFGSFHLWGDVPALMPVIAPRSILKPGIAHRSDGSTNFHGQKVLGFRFDGPGKSFQTASVEKHEGFKTRHVKVGGMKWYHPSDPRHTKGQGFNTLADRQNREGVKHDNSGWRENRTLKSNNRMVPDGIKGGGGSWFGDCATMKETRSDGLKQGGDWFSDPKSMSCTTSSKPPARKAASALIAKIPDALSRHIARCYLPPTASNP